MKQIISHAFIALLSAAFSFVMFHQFYPGSSYSVHPRTASARLVNNEPFYPVNKAPQALPVLPDVDFVPVSRTVTSSVVNITVLRSDGVPVSNGSGVVFSADGYIVTNHHVVEEGSRLEVTLPNKRRLQARVIGSDPATDLALIKVSGINNLQALPLANSDLVEVGQWVLAVGNPFNLFSTVTAGIISAKGRNLNIIEGSYSIESFIQTDAVVNPGNSGGALVNTAGELVGINTAIISETGGYEGYSFAIPANLVRKVVRDLQEFGIVRRAILGVRINDLSDEAASRLKLPSVEGVLIYEVTPGGSADRAGMRADDVIISVNGMRTNTVPELQEQVARFRPGDRISLEFFRDGRKYRREEVILQGVSNGYSNY